MGESASTSTDQSRLVKRVDAPNQRRRCFHQKKEAIVLFGEIVGIE